MSKWWLTDPKSTKPKLEKYSAAPNPSSSEFEVNNWELSQLVLQRVVPVVGYHPFPLNELLLMTAAVSRFRPRLIFEWGTHIGKSARAFYEISQALNIDTTIHSIDLPDSQEHVEHPHSERAKMVRGIAKVKLHQGDGLDTSLAELKHQKGSAQHGKRVLFFVDGDHSRKSVERELAAIIKTAPNAAILLHDTFYQDQKSRYNIGPARAIEEVLKKSNRKYKRIDTATGLPGMTLLYSA